MEKFERVVHTDSQAPKEGFAQLIAEMEAIAAHDLTLDTHYTAIPKKGSRQDRPVFFSISDRQNTLGVTIYTDTSFSQKIHTLSADTLLSFVEDFVFEKNSPQTEIATSKVDELSYTKNQEKTIRRQLQQLKNLGIAPNEKHIGIPKHTVDRGFLHFSITHGPEGLVITYYSDETHDQQEIYGTYMVDDFLGAHNNNFVFKKIQTTTADTDHNHREKSQQALEKTIREHEEESYINRYRLRIDTPYVFVSKDVNTPTYFLIKKINEVCDITIYTDNSFSEMKEVLTLQDFSKTHPHAEIAPTVPRSTISERYNGKNEKEQPAREATKKDIIITSEKKHLTENSENPTHVTKTHLSDQTKPYTQPTPQENPRDLLITAKTTEDVIAITENTLGVSLKPNGSHKNAWNIVDRVKFYLSATPGQQGLLLFAQKRLAILTKDNTPKH